ncbi:MAG: 2-dehydropantoate 2-reductase [Pseudomonadota bacterium]
MTGRAAPLRKIVILGAGAIGTHTGAAWAGAAVRGGASISLIGRAATLAGFRETALRLTGGPDGVVPELTCGIDPAMLAGADLVILAMKATGLHRAVGDIRTHADPGTPLISLLNGLAPVRELAAALPGHKVIAGMVPYNVVWRGPAHLHRSSAGDLALARSAETEALANLVAESGLSPVLHDDLAPIQYGKLLLNLINPINALAGIPLHAMLSDRGYRRIYAATLREALMVYRAAGISWQKVGPISPRLAVHLLGTPDALFNPTLLKVQKIDPNSMTSMASDVMAGRPTEIEAITGEILHIAGRAGIRAPVNQALADEIRLAERAGTSPRHSAAALAKLVLP